jgi:hypothetical protein
MNNITVIDFIIAYCRLGISNFQLLIDNFNNWTFGMNTFLNPLYFISKDFNYQLDVASANVYLWGGAPQYFFGYLYMYFVIFFAICTTIVVPIFRAVEFWVLIIIAIVSLYFVNFVTETEV